MATAGPSFAGTAANYNDGAPTAWSNPTNVQGDTTSTEATSSPANNTNTQILRATNFGFSIPTASTINGITVEWEKSCSGGNARIIDQGIQLLVAGEEAGADKSGVGWTTTKAFASYGGVSDVWSASLTPAIVNATGFGASLKARRSSGAATTASVFRVRITVTYTEHTAPTVTTQAVSSIAVTTATGNGNVTADGGPTVTERGVVANTTGTPTTADLKFTAASGGTGAFTADMTSLSPGTHYYVRAYAINSIGTAYGSGVEFDTESGDATLTQTAYRIGRDDGAEGENTWYASENTPTSVPAGQNFRVRAQVTSTGTASPALSWQARKWDSDLEEWGEWEAVRLGTAMLLTVSGDNGRYLMDGNGEPVLLVGFHTWNNVQNSGTSAPPDEFDWSEYLGALTGRGLNFTKLWTYESPRGWGRYRGIMRYERSGTSGAADGGNKFDLTALDSAWITRLRARVESCLAAGVWVCVQLFQGWDAEDKGIENSWTYHPFASANNVNSVDGDTNANGSGEETRRLASNPVLSYQETEVTAVVTALNQYPNIIWEISNEDTGHSENTAWQEYWMEYIRDLEADMPLQHLVGMTIQYPSGSNATLTSSSADWVSYSNRNSVDGTKASMSDTDHIEGLTDTFTWIWIGLCNGHGGLWYMDSWDGGGYDADTRANSTYNLIRDNLGYAATLAGLIGSDLLLMTPQGGLSTSGYCLARNHATAGKYVAFYDGAGTFNLNLSTATGTLQVRWLRCSTGATSTSTVSGGDVRTMTPPWTGAVVLYVYHEGGG